MTVGSNPPAPDAIDSPGGDAANDLRSAPEQNAPPAPVRMAQRMSALLSTSSQASAIPCIISPDSAFLASGRFMVTIST
jgi:hypothetical protein